MCLFLIYFGVSGTNCTYKKALINIKAKKGNESMWELSRGRHHRHPHYLEWGRFCLPRHLNLYYYESTQ
jgi:hypothetical protein